jgi:hypothetical protein
MYRALLLLIISLLIVSGGCTSQTGTVSMTAPSPSNPEPTTTIAYPIATNPSTNITSSRPTVLPGDTVTTASGALIYFTLDDLIKNSDAAVIGKVVEILPAKKVLTDPLVYTYVIIQPERNLFGDSQSDRIAVRVDGGRIGDTVMVAEDEAEFTVGEECLVFLVHPTSVHSAPEGFNDKNYYKVWAGTGGKFEIEDGSIHNGIDMTFTLCEVVQKVAAIRGNK